MLFSLTAVMALGLTTASPVTTVVAGSGSATRSVAGSGSQSSPSYQSILALPSSHSRSAESLKRGAVFAARGWNDQCFWSAFAPSDWMYVVGRAEAVRTGPLEDEDDGWPRTCGDDEDGDKECGQGTDLHVSPCQATRGRPASSSRSRTPRGDWRPSLARSPRRGSPSHQEWDGRRCASRR